MPPDDAGSLTRLRRDAKLIFDEAIEAVSPEAAVRSHLTCKGGLLTAGDFSVDLSTVHRLFVVGAGKAAATMAAAVESILPGRITDGIVTVKYGHGAPLEKIRIVEAGHPVPDENGCRGAAQILSLVSGATAGDLVICLISGGGSALFPLPADGITLAEKQAATRTLLACGAPIHPVNALRKHLSAVKGGQLARAAAPAWMLTLILSDVVGDALDVIASGPTVPDNSTYGDCLDIIETYRLAESMPESVLARLKKGAAGALPETPKPGDGHFLNQDNIVIASNATAMAAARHRARALGYRPLLLSSLFEGETRELARFHTAILREVFSSGNPVSPPACIISGGESTVTLRGNGKGGRNQEFVLAATGDIAHLPDLVVFSAGTDGTDGPTDAAGAVADPRTFERARHLGMSPAAYLRNNDAYHFFKNLGDLVITGPTRTNVMDLRIILIA